MSEHAEGVRRPKARERKPHFFEDPNVDRLIAMMVSLTQEVSIIRERMDTFERLLSHKDVFEAGEVDQFPIDSQAAQDREALRQRLISRVFSVLEDELESLQSRSINVEKVVEEIQNG